jgi:hypothetical protein
MGRAKEKAPTGTKSVEEDVLVFSTREKTARKGRGQTNDGTRGQSYPKTCYQKGQFPMYQEIDYQSRK